MKKSNVYQTITYTVQKKTYSFVNKVCYHGNENNKKDSDSPPFLVLGLLF